MTKLYAKPMIFVMDLSLYYVIRTIYVGNDGVGKYVNKSVIGYD